MSTDGAHPTWMPHAVSDTTPAYDGRPPIPRDGCDLCEKYGHEICGYHGGEILYCSRCGHFRVRRSHFLPPDEPGGIREGTSCYCRRLPDVGGVSDSHPMQFLGYEATVDPRIKARTDGVKDPRDRITTMCRFCAHEDYEDRNDADHIVQLRVRCGNGVTSYPVCEDCRRSHGWDRSDVRRLFNTEGDDE